MERFQRMHDVLLFFTKSPAGYPFNTLYGYETISASNLKRFKSKKQLADFSSGVASPA